MDAQLKQKWIDELRLGDYVKIRKHLFGKQPGEHCALGVLVYGVCNFPLDRTFSVELAGYDYLKNKIGITGEQEEYIWYLNDNKTKNLSFDEIAKAIEEEF